VPLLDTRLLSRLASGRKQESYWPVAVAASKFHCIILKGGDRHPYFPRPLLTDFDFQVPISGLRAPKRGPSAAADAMDDDADADASPSEQTRLEELYIRTSVQHTQLSSTLSFVHPTPAQRALLPRLELEVDKALLQLLALECREGEERGMRALEIVQLMRDRTGKMLEAAGKVAARFGRDVLGEKIREVAERRLVGLEGEDEEMG
jgi:chromosome transmission fidelity protein 4